MTRMAAEVVRVIGPSIFVSMGDVFNPEIWRTPEARPDAKAFNERQQFRRHVRSELESQPLCMTCQQSLVVEFVELGARIYCMDGHQERFVHKVQSNEIS